MHPLGCNVYIIYGLCKKHLTIFGLKFFLMKLFNFFMKTIVVALALGS
jgi:hypothetical protein